jgi:formylglycine-generating enzyme required for sulfatase activity
LSFQIGLTITLPTEQQWQRAAQGDDERAYPWGDKFDPALCNTYESRIRHTTPVNRYPAGASPNGVCDMIGNIWEWCLNAQDGALDMNSRAQRAVRGGSFISTRDRARVLACFHLNPLCRYDTIGFRIVCN